MRGADSFSQAHFKRTLGDAHQHDVHHDDAADHECDERNRNHDLRDAAGELVDLIVDLFDVHETKIIFVVSIEPMFDPHRHASIFDGRLQSFSACDSCHESADRFARRSADEW